MSSNVDAGEGIKPSYKRQRETLEEASWFVACVCMYVCVERGVFEVASVKRVMANAVANQY